MGTGLSVDRRVDDIRIPAIIASDPVGDCDRVGGEMIDPACRSDIPRPEAMRERRHHQPRHYT